MKHSLTLALYMGRTFLAYVFVASLVLAVVVFAADMIGLMDNAASRPLITNNMVMKLALLKLSDTLLMLVPFAVMIGTLLCFARLTRTHELIAMRASGISVWQFLLAPAIVCLGIGMFNLAVLNPFAASTLKKYERLHSELFPGSAKGLLVEGGTLWLKQPITDGGEVIIRAEKVHEEGRILEDVTIFRFGPRGRFISLVSAKNMELTNGAWQIKDVAILGDDKPAERLKSATLPTDMTIDNIQSSFTSPNTMAIWELPKFIHILSQSGFNTQAHEMHFQRSLAAPLMSLAMFLLAVPFALRFSRQGGVGKLLLAGLLFGFGFYLLSNIIGAYGLSGRINLVLAAWMPALITAMMGTALLLHFGEE